MAVGAFAGGGFFGERGASMRGLKGEPVESPRDRGGWRFEQRVITSRNITEGERMSVEVKAPMPGKILEVLVKVGDQVNEDDEVIMLEAMKMENPIYAPAGGTVKEIKVKANDSVETEQVMMVIE
jgi:biotin carboxyl carrier protein